MSELVKKRWFDLLEPYCNNTALLAKWWNRVAFEYSRKERHYHTLIHVENIIIEIEKSVPLPKREILYLVAIFHDVVYIPTHLDNEIFSGEFAKKTLTILNFPFEKTRQVCAIITASQHMLKLESFSAALFVDIDLIVLGSSKQNYLTYCGQVRDEYGMFSDEVFKKGRSLVLKEFLNRKRIYQTDKFHRLYESKARKNILSELQDCVC